MKKGKSCANTCMRIDAMLSADKSSASNACSLSEWLAKCHKLLGPASSPVVQETISVPKQKENNKRIQVVCLVSTAAAVAPAGTDCDRRVGSCRPSQAFKAMCNCGSIRGSCCMMHHACVCVNE